jgi:hypothetical protein
LSGSSGRIIVARDAAGERAGRSRRRRTRASKSAFSLLYRSIIGFGCGYESIEGVVARSRRIDCAYHTRFTVARIALLTKEPDGLGIVSDGQIPFGKPAGSVRWNRDKARTKTARVLQRIARLVKGGLGDRVITRSSRKDKGDYGPIGGVDGWGTELQLTTSPDND